MHLVTDMEMGADILAANRRIAEDNQAKLRLKNVLSYDFRGAIGSGKTLIIEALLDILDAKGVNCAVIAGDVAGDDDYRRFKAHGIPVENVNTGKDCHLDAHRVDHALEHLDLDTIEVLFIENVGNLVCPADFPLGTDKNVTVISVTEGGDMVRKHPVLMGLSDVIVINKVGLAKVMDVDPDVLVNDAHRIAPHVPVVLTDAREGIGLKDLFYALDLD